MNRFNRIRHHVDIKDVKKRHLEETAAKKLEKKRLKEEIVQINSEYEKRKSDWREELDLKESDWTPIDSPITNSTSQTFTYTVPNSETGEPNTFTVSGLGGVESLPSSVKVDFGFGESPPDGVNPPSYNQLALAGYAKPILIKRRDPEDVNPKLDASQEFTKKIDAEVSMNARVSPSEYQVPGSKEYKDMQRLSFDEWIKKVPPFAYGSQDNFIINDPERRWRGTYMRQWAAQNKAPMNVSRVKALKNALDPTTGKLVNPFAETELTKLVKSKLMSVGNYHYDEMGNGPYGRQVVEMVLQKGPAALSVYMIELGEFEKHMSGVVDILNKDLIDVRNNLKSRYVKPSEIQRRTARQADNYGHYYEKLEQIRQDLRYLKTTFPTIQRAFAGNFDALPIKPPKPPAEFNYMDDMPPEGGTFDKDGNYIPPGFEDAIRTDQIYDADEVSAALKDPGRFESLLRNVADRVNVGTAKNIYDYHLRFLNNPTSRIQDVSKLVKKKDLEELIKLINSIGKKKLKFAPKHIYGDLQRIIKRTPGLANGIGNLNQAKLYVRGNYYYIEKPYDFSNILDTIGAKGLNAPAYALLQTLRGKMKLRDFLLGTKTMNMRIKIPINKS